MPGSWRRIALLSMGLNLLVALAVGLLLALSRGAVGPAAIARSVAISLIYGTLIGLPAWLLIDLAVERLRGRSTLSVWLAIVAIVLALTVAACAIAGLVLVALGWSDPAVYWRSFFYSGRIALVVGAICTASGFAWDRLHSRLEASRAREARARELAAEARLNALEARVHPHFLFNSLNSVLSLIPAEPGRAEELLEKIAALLRFALEAGKSSLIPLGDELRIVRDYLDIEAARLGERLRSQVEVEPGLESWPVPPFAVQTLVENSVRHAIARRRAGGLVRVRGRRAGGRLELSVFDDGDGFTRAALRPGHGIDNLEGRIGALFGDRGGLTLRRGEGGMTVVVAVPP
ncbi:MAG TPA: histidine kinase [Kofleriaceae bacterium]|nr:histidine kinase [Kofleriaceae bacterium]